MYLPSTAAPLYPLRLLWKLQDMFIWSIITVGGREILGPTITKSFTNKFPVLRRHQAVAHRAAAHQVAAHRQIAVVPALHHLRLTHLQVAAVVPVLHHRRLTHLQVAAAAPLWRYVSLGPRR